MEWMSKRLVRWLLVVDAIHVANARQEYEKCLHGKFPLICLRTVNGNDELTCRDYRLHHEDVCNFLHKVFYVIAHRTPDVACARLINKSPPHTYRICHHTYTHTFTKYTAYSTHKYHFICIIYMWVESCVCVHFFLVKWFIYIRPIKNFEVWRCCIRH